MSQPNESPTNPVLALVHQGWEHLRLQRPLAAWASWQRALRAAPDDPAARQALDRLASAVELPPAARAEYKFQTPTDPDRRARWDARLAGRRLDDLPAAAGAFAAILEDDPGDADARLNLALCHAWLGRNAEAVAELDRAVSALAGPRPDRAADAWTLAEVLRLGAGAEELADDLRYAWVLDLDGADPLPPDLPSVWPNLVRLPMPVDPVTGAPQVGEGEVFAWLDRPELDPGAAPARAEDLPRVLASVVRTPRVLRVSSPDPSGFDVLTDPPFARVERALRRARREKTPLAIAWADAALGTFRFPAGVDDLTRAGLARDAVEFYYEGVWVHVPRQALDGRTPLRAAAEAAAGDAVARARLAGVVRFREQLGARPTHAAVYQGYPFDRLRRRLGLIDPADASASLDPADLSCAGPGELDALDPAGLDALRLGEALLSAIGLRDDARTARFAAEAARRDPPPVSGLGLAAVFAPLVREALRLGDPEEALAWLGRARALDSGPDARTFAVWAAEVYARTGNPRAALEIYQELLDRPEADAPLALDAAETLLDNGYPDQALPLLLDARARARASGDRVTLDRAELLLNRGGAS